MKQFNFNAPNYSNLAQREDRYFEGLKEGIGTLASTPKNAYDSRYREEDDKRKWDNLLEQQRYQRERDAINDQRYNDELNQRLGERQGRIDAMNAHKDFMRNRYGIGYDNTYNEIGENGRSMDGFDDGSQIDDAASIRYGREVNGAKKRTRNLVANGLDYETMKADPRDFVGNGKFAASSPNGNPYANLEQFGEGAVMAAAMMDSATNPEDYWAAYNHLNGVISMYNQNKMAHEESERAAAVSRADDMAVDSIVLDPVFSTVNKLAAGMPDRQYTAADIQGMIDSLERLERSVRGISDTAKRMEVQSKIDNAYGKLSGIYGRKTAPGPRRK